MVDLANDLANINLANMVDYVLYMPDDYTEVMKGPFGTAYYEAPSRAFLAQKQHVLDEQHTLSNAIMPLVGRPLTGVQYCYGCRTDQRHRHCCGYRGVEAAPP